MSSHCHSPKVVLVVVFIFSDVSWCSSHPYAPSRLHWSRNEAVVKPMYSHGSQAAQELKWKTWQATKPRSQNPKAKEAKKTHKKVESHPEKTKDAGERERERNTRTIKKIPSRLIQGRVSKVLERISIIPSSLGCGVPHGRSSYKDQAHQLLDISIEGESLCHCRKITQVSSLWIDCLVGWAWAKRWKSPIFFFLQLKPFHSITTNVFLTIPCELPWFLGTSLPLAVALVPCCTHRVETSAIKSTAESQWTCSHMIVP